MAFRRPAQDEVRMLRELLVLAKFEHGERWLAALRVEEMNDGGMGSLRLSPEPRPFGKALAAVQFTDADGVVVVAPLNADADGEPIEVDMWKTDFKPLIRIADALEPAE